MRYLNRGSVVVALLSASALLVDGSRSGAMAVQPSPNPMVVAQTVEARKATADRLLQQGIQKFQNSYKKPQITAAIQLLHQSLEIYRELKNKQGEREALRHLGKAYYQLSTLYETVFVHLDLGENAREALRNYHAKAIEAFEQSLTIARELKDLQGEDQVLQDLDEIRDNVINGRTTRNYSKKIEYIEQRLAIAHQLNNRGREGVLLGDLGFAYHQLDQKAKAIECYEQSLAIARELKDQQAEREALKRLASYYGSLGDFTKKIDYYEQSLVVARDSKDKNGECDLLRTLAINYHHLSKYAKEIKYYERMLVIARSLKESKDKIFDWESTAQSGLESAYRALRNEAKANEYAALVREEINSEPSSARIEVYERSLVNARRNKDLLEEQETLDFFVSLYFKRRNYSKAFEYQNRVLAITRERKDLRAEASNLRGLGYMYASLGNYSKAIEYYEQSLEIGRKIEIESYSFNQLTLNGLGDLYSSMSNYFKAIEYYEQSLAIERKETKYIAYGLLSFHLNRLGSAYSSLKNYARAIDYYQEVLMITRRFSDREGEAKSLVNIASSLEKQKQLELAIVFYKESVNVYEVIRTDIRQLPRESQESYTQSVAGTYRRLADLLLAQGRVLEAQQVLELLKIQELRDFSRDTRAGGNTNGSPLTPREAPIPPAFSDKIALGQKLTACESQTPRCPERESLQTQLTTANTTFNQLADRLRSQQSTKDPAQLQRDELTLAAQKVVLAQPKTVLIYPLVLEDKLWLVWGSQAGSKGVVFDSKEIPVSRKELSATVLRFRQLLTSPGDLKEFQQVSQKLYGWLIAPIRPQLDANGIQNLVFSLDRATRYIPMAALHDGQHYLVEKFAISTILTAGTTDTTDKLAANPTSTKVLGLGLSTAVSGLNPLPNVVNELNGIIHTQPTDTGIFPGSKFLNQAFDRRAFKDLIDYRILHIATHGKFVSGQPEDSFLVLGNGDPLRIPEIKSMPDLNAIHLVVLSACETAKGGEDKEGLEVSGLSYYFITSGAKAVIASLWLVNDASTSLLMQRFYQNLPKGMSKTEALRQAQLSLLNQKTATTTKPDRSDIEPTISNQQTRSTQIPPGYSHPYYWAPFILIGNGL